MVFRDTDAAPFQAISSKALIVVFDGDDKQSLHAGLNG